MTQQAYSSETSTLGAAAIHALNKFKEMLTSSGPRKVSRASNRCVHIFTDASFEPQADRPFAGIGAVLVDDSGNKLKFISEELDPILTEEINVSKRKTIIFECKFFSVLCACVTWKAYMSQCNVMIHTDDDAVRDVFIACHPASENVLPILDTCLECEISSGCNSWISRVPTESNIADGTSRLQIKDLINCGCQWDRVDCLELWSARVRKAGPL